MKTSNLSFDTKCVHAGIVDNEFGAVVPPIYQTSTFKFQSVQQGAKLFAGEEKGYIYTRMANPTVEALENCIAELEGGYKGLGCASGMAAIHTVLATLTSAGDHVLCSSAVYGPTTTLLNTILKKFGVDADYIDTSNLEEVKKGIKPNTKIVYIETPGNPTLYISDIEEISKLAKKHNAVTIVDNTFMSPALQRPLELGADIVLHSLTKFLNGHADVVGGVIDPFNSFLVHRGIKTLSIRMQRHCENSQLIAEYLEKHSLIQKVVYPGLKSHPQYALGLKQHSGHGGMITFEMAGGFEDGAGPLNLCNIFQ